MSDLWPGGFWNQPIGFYVVGIPMMIVIVGLSLGLATLGLVLIGMVVGAWADFVLDLVRRLKGEEE